MSTSSQPIIDSTKKKICTIIDWKHGNQGGLSLLAEVKSDFNSTFGLVVSGWGSGRENPFSREYICDFLTEIKLPSTLYDKISLIIENLVEAFTQDRKTSCKSIESYMEDYLEVCRARVWALYSGVCDTCYCYTGRLPSKKASEKFLKRYFIFSILDELEEKYKYHTNYLACSLTEHSELPSGSVYPGERAGVVIGGWVRRYFTKKTRSLKEKIGFAKSLLNAKRAAKAISQRKQIQAVIDHQQNMLGKGYKATAYQASFLTDVRKKIDKLVKLIYPRNIEEHIPVWRIPSQGACYQNNKRAYGSMGKFYQEYYRQDVNSHFADLVVQNEINLCNTLNDIGNWVDIKIPIFSFGFNINDMRKMLMERLYTTTKCRARFAKVLEPFKVRGITASDCYVYQFGRMIQPVLHKYLRDPDGPFRFIGKRHNEDDINKVYKGVVFHTEEQRIQDPLCFNYDKWNYKTFFVAGDYKSATDNMEPSLPEQFITSLCAWSNLSDEWKRVLKLTLGSHIIEYPRIDALYKDLMEKYLLEVDQKWGQLMGSPTSFPILNIVNAAMFWVSVEFQLGIEVSWFEVLKEFRPLFNGDDISFVSNKDHYQIWKDVCTGCGLALSPGKNYCSQHFVNINSTDYTAELLENGDFKVVGSLKESFLVNAGLLRGQGKVLLDERDLRDGQIPRTNIFGDEEEIPETGLSPTVDKLFECIRTADAEQRRRTLEVFFEHMSVRLSKSNRSWLLPRHLGGLGLPFGSVNESQFEVALQQLKDYKDLSDYKHKGEFVTQSNEYWRALRESLPESVDIRMPMVYHGYQDDPLLDYHELPCLSMCFLSDGTIPDKWKEEPNKKNKKRKNRHPEYRFIKIKRKFRMNNPSNVIDHKNTTQRDKELILTTLLETKLSSGGSKKEVRVDVCIPRVEFSDIMEVDPLFIFKEFDFPEQN